MPDPIESAVDVAEHLVPPELKFSDSTKWRMWIAGVLTVTSTGLIVHILLACGYLPFYAGFAKAGEAQGVEEKITAQVNAMEQRVMSKIDSQADTLKTQRINTLKKDLFDTRQKQCKAPTGPVRTMLAEQITNMNTEYKTLAGEAYPLPGCSDF